MSRRPHIFILCLLAALPAPALQIRNYLPASHDRFTGFPATPVANPTFLYDNSRFTGVAWLLSNTNRQYALVSRHHFLCATHSPPGNGQSIRFMASDGSLVTRVVASVSTVPNPDTSPSDLSLGLLTSSVLPSDGIAPFPYLDLPTENAYLGTSLIVFGRPAVYGSSPRAGEGTISLIDDLSGEGLNDTRVLDFVYYNISGGPNDAKLEAGDSGSPCFALVNDVPAVVGTNSAVDDSHPPHQDNYSAFVPHYIDGLDDLMEPAGYRMRPVYAAPTNLTATLTPTPATFRRGHPGEILIEVANAGSETAGNVELTLSFPTGNGPDTVTAPDWIVESGGADTWLLRRTTLTSSETKSLTANWSALPLDESLNGSLDHLSDSSPAGNAAINNTLLPSFAEWESETGVSGLTGDPDFDNLDNLLEYALGGDPLSGTLLLDGQHPLTLQIAASAGTTTISFPIRTDAALRGLSYIVEWSSDLQGGSWTTTAPPGTATNDEAWSPAVTGFQRRTITWPTTPGPLFARLRVELDESP